MGIFSIFVWRSLVGRWVFEFEVLGERFGTRFRDVNEGVIGWSTVDKVERWKNL